MPMLRDIFYHAHELQELFTIEIKNYTEDDIKK